MPEGVRSYDGEYRRRQILEVALGLFLRRSFKGTPMSSIAEEVGISKAGLYYHFKTKEDILRALYFPSFTELEALLDKEYGWRELLEKYLQIILENRELSALVLTDLSVLSHAEISDRALAINRRLLEALVGEGASLSQRMRGECALSALRAAAMGFPEADEATVQEVGLRAAEAVLGS